jgi:radical SAM superfamily enzyme YgiQ (UPF0313 family)
MLLDKKKEKEYALHEYINRLIRFHVSGRLKVAPEHTEDHILTTMRKPSFDNFLKFKKVFDNINNSFQLNQQLIPYFISSHPACRLQDMQNLHKKIRQINYKLEQVQDFTPTPLTLSSVIFYTGIHPYTGENVFCETQIDKKKQQNQYFFK